MKIKPSIAGIIGAILSIIGLFLFLGIDLSPYLFPSIIPVIPLIGGVILGVGFAILFHEKDLVSTLIAFLGSLFLVIFNWIAIGFSLGLLLPGITGRVKNFPVYLAAIFLFLGTMFSVMNSPGTYQEMFLDQIVDITYQNTGNLQNSMQAAIESQIDNMLPTRSQIQEMVNSMLPCENQTYKELCLSARQQMTDQIYQRIHSPEYKQELLSKMPKIQVTKDQIKQLVMQMPLVKALMDNIHYIIASLVTGWFLIFSLSITIPQGITSFFLDLFSRKKEG